MDLNERELKMAYIDYKHCAVCEGKVFYDTDIHHTYPWSEDPETAEKWQKDGHLALCPQCYKTHRLKVVERND
jgi:hypothetical protein